VIRNDETDSWQSICPNSFEHDEFGGDQLAQHAVRIGLRRLGESRLRERGEHEGFGDL